PGEPGVPPADYDQLAVGAVEQRLDGPAVFVEAVRQTGVPVGVQRGLSPLVHVAHLDDVPLTVLARLGADVLAVLAQEPARRRGDPARRVVAPGDPRETVRRRRGLPSMPKKAASTRLPSSSCRAVKRW